jgi:hypothetical protein
MSSNSKTKSRPTINRKGHDKNTVIQFSDQKKLGGNLKFPIENARKCAAAERGKLEATIGKIRKEANIASIGKEKLKLLGKTCKTHRNFRVTSNFVGEYTCH